MDAECKTLWMGDIQPHWDEAFLGSLFAGCAEQPVIKMIRDKVTGYPSGYGFLEFPSQQGAQYVLENFNGQTVPNTMHRFRMNWGAGGRRIESSDDHSIFVGDLAPDVTDEVLLATFASRFSSVRNAKVVTDPMTRMSKGFGFVRFGIKEEADQALQTMSGVYCGSRPMRVSVATDRNRPRPDYGMQGGMGGMQGHDMQGDGANTTVFVGGLDPAITEDDLRSRFAPFGDIMSVKIPPGRGCGFVHFIVKDTAEMAINQMNGTQLGGSRIRCAWGRSSGGRGNSGGGYYQQQYGAQQYGQAGYQQYYGGYDASAYYAQYAQAGYGGYAAYGAGGYDQNAQQQAQGQQQAYGGAQQGYYGAGYGQQTQSHNQANRRAQFQEQRDFTQRDNIEGMNRRYASQRAFQHMAPVPSSSYSPMSSDVAKNTAMATQ